MSNRNNSGPSATTNEYAAEIQPNGIIYQKTIDQSYPQGDYHTMYVGKIEKVLVRDEEYLK